MHGKTSSIFHNGQGIFTGLSNPITAARYHSLVVKDEGLPDELEVVARTADGTIMALKHRNYPLWGVQFHPESILTPEGRQLMNNFMTVS